MVITVSQSFGACLLTATTAILMPSEHWCMFDMPQKAASVKADLFTCGSGVMVFAILLRKLSIGCEYGVASYNELEQLATHASVIILSFGCFYLNSKRQPNDNLITLACVIALVCIVNYVRTYSMGNCIYLVTTQYQSCFCQLF